MDILYFGSIDWDYLWQRPQQIITRLARSHRILFVDPPFALNRVKIKHADGLRELGPNIYGCTPPTTLPFKNASYLSNRLGYRIVTRQVRRHMQHLEFKDPVLWVSHPQAGVLVGKFNERLVCYDCMEDHVTFKPFARRDVVRDMEIELFERADIILTLSPALFDKARAVAAHDRVFLVRDGGDPAHFTMDAPPHDALFHVGHPVIGFVGSIYEWVDIDLIEYIAQQRPEWTVVMVGPIKSRSTEKRLAAIPNIRLLGRQAYTDLPGLIRHFDVCLLPFIPNRHIAHADPIMLYDYLACGKPVVTTDFPAARAFGDVVRIGNDPERFLDGIEQSLRNDSPVRAAGRRRRVMPHSWDRRVTDIQDIFQKAWHRSGRSRSCHLVVGATVGGVERHAHDLLVRLNEEEPATALCSEGHTARLMRVSGIRTRTVTLDHIYDVGGLLRLIRVLRQERPALLHTHDRRGNLYGWLASWFTPAYKRVATVHRHIRLQTAERRRDGPVHRVDRMMLRSADRIIAVSRSIATELTRQFYLPEDLITVIHPGVDLSRFRHGASLTREARQAIMQQWDIPPSNRLIGVLGRMEIEKGQPDLLEILPDIVEGASAATILIIGEGSFSSHLEQYVHDRGLDIYVRLIGFQEDVPRLLRTLDLVIVPSLGEAFGTVVAEAMAMAKPVVAYATGDVPEIISEDGVNGVLVPPDDRTALTETVLSLLRDDERREKIGLAARETVEQQFTIDRMMREIREVYEAVAAEGEQDLFWG